MSKVTIIMYHYVRDLKHSRFPEIKGLPIDSFKEQIDYLSKHYTFVTMQQCIDMVYSDGETFPDNAVLLTFDDGYIDHYTNVFPILDFHGIQGSFFPPAMTILDNEILDVNKIHFILASEPDRTKIIDDITIELLTFKDDYSLEDPISYYRKLAVPSRFDDSETIYIKRILQRELPEELRHNITEKLFRKYVTEDTETFARELYMNTDQLKCMANNGMFIGAHGNNHYWMNTLTDRQQEDEIVKSSEFLSLLGVSADERVMCYPYGAFDDRLISVLKKHDFKLGLSTEPEIAILDKEHAFQLDRLDTNDIPKSSSSSPSISYSV